MSQLEFKDVAAAALSAAHTLLPQWLGGKKSGHEWIGARRADGGPGDSWSVNLNTGLWGHFANGDAGGDLISLYAALNGLSQIAALDAVAAQLGMGDKLNGHSRSTADTPRVNGHDGTDNARVHKTGHDRTNAHQSETQSARIRPSNAAEPIPKDAPPIPDNPSLGSPQAVYQYGDAFVVCRYESADSKSFRPLTWRAGRWQFKAYPDPKPIYGAELLSVQPDAPILVVEGEKCAHVGRSTLPEFITVTWAGGADAILKSQWSVLHNRIVTIWPDADQPGRKAAAALSEALEFIAAKVIVVNPPQDTPLNWDIADAVRDGMSADDIRAWMLKHQRVIGDPVDIPTDDDQPPDYDYPEYEIIPEYETSKQSSNQTSSASSNQTVSAVVSWKSLGLDSNQGGVPFATLSNASIIIQFHPDLRGKIWLDSFRQKIYHSLHGEPKQWTQHDTLALTAMIQQSLHLPKFTVSLVGDAVEHAAHLNQRNSLTDWLNSLIWDGIPRLDTWLTDTLGVDHNEYTMAVSRNWPIGMVARAFKPGCKMDNMVVLEGASGLAKTTFLETLGHPWYKALPMNFGEKDFMQAMQGAWLIEVPDMTGFRGRDHTQILAIITIRDDSYRASYGRYVEDHPRVTVFAATSEVDDYLQDARGRRRYWPLRCKEINIIALREQREQVFAEAVQRYRAGASWHVMPADADSEQLARASSDLWTTRILELADDLWNKAVLSGRPAQITSTYLLEFGAEVAVSKQTDTEKKRVARIMREGGWIQHRTTKARYWVRPGNRCS